MTPALLEAAKGINQLARQVEDARAHLAVAIAAAMDLVKKESNLSFKEWADQYLRQPNGEKWNLSYLYKMAMFGRDLSKLDKYRENVAAHGRDARERRWDGVVKNNNARHALRAQSVAAMNKPKPQEIDIEKDLARLMSAWNSASPEARKRFLQTIVARKQA